MNKIKRIEAARKTVLVGWVIAIVGAILILFHRLHIIGNGNNQIPIWMIAFFVFASLVMLAGVFLGSRGVGIPLNTERYFSLSFGYPCWIAAIIYLTILILSRFV